MTNTPCGGCGETDPNKRCFGCLHSFRDGELQPPLKCQCDECNEEILTDVLIPDEIWAKISPRPVDGYKSGGLLCGQCIANKLIKAISPREPTPEMIQAGVEALFTPNVKDTSANGTCMRIYQAMHAKALDN